MADFLKWLCLEARYYKNKQNFMENNTTIFLSTIKNIFS